MSSSFAVVETLLNEFYQPGTSNIRKREIEAELIAFRSQPNAWQLCLRSTSTSESNQFVWFYCTSTLEFVITRRWAHLTAADRALLRETLWNAYASLSVLDVQRRQRDTFAQLIALMGKREFPEEHPNYMLHCIELIKSPKFVLGVNLLRITSEEVVSNREDVTTDRKKYFHSCISMCMPDVLDLLTKYLLIAVCHVNGKDIHSLPNNLMDFTLFTWLPNDNQLSSSLLELLACLQHLVSWIRTDLISGYFLMSVLDLAQWRAGHEDISLAALSVLNELLYLQKSLPYAVTIMSGVNGLLEQHNTTKHQSEMYVDKFRELLRSYTMKYLPKMLQENELLEAFVKALYCCTISKNGALDFTEKLEIWSTIIRGLAINQKLNRYHDILHQLVVEIMRRTQFEYNKAELELLDIDNENMEEGVQTEWQQFLTQCIDCIALIGELQPNVVFTEVFSYWPRSYQHLLSIESDINSCKTQELQRKLKCQSFNEHLRDLSTVCQVVVRIAPLVDISSPEAADINCHLHLLTDNLLNALKFFTSKKLAFIDKSPCQTDFEYLYAQVLMAIRSILPISTYLNTEEVLRGLFDAVGSIFLADDITTSPLIYMAGSELLQCITTVIRPRCLLGTTTLMNLLQEGFRFVYLPREAITKLYISLIGYFVLPWKNIDDKQQDYANRCVHLTRYVECLGQNFLQTDLSDDLKIPRVTTAFLNVLSPVIDYFSDSSNMTKDLLATAFKPIITKSLVVYKDFSSSNDAVAIPIANFSLSIVRTLQNQLGTSFIKEMITLFIAVNSSEQISVARLTVVEKVLQMFKLIVEQPGNASMSMLPSILDFTIERILPLLQQDGKLTDSTDISSVVYSLFDSILTCKWQYFYKSHVQNNGSLLQGGGGDNLHPEHFIAILNLYGQVIVTGTDPNIVRTVLTSMQNVNDRWRLYQRSLFKDNLLASFQSALINVLLSGEGALHFDLLANTLYAMGQVDTLKLRESFVTAGFSVNMKIIDEICLSTDIPTFSQKLSQLIQDAHWLHLMQT